MLFEVARGQQSLLITGYDFTYRLRCLIDGNTELLGTGGGWPLPTRVQNGHFAVDALDQSEAFEFSGFISPNLAAGLSRLAVPQFTRHEVPQSCTTGDLSWHAAPTSA
jgi:hypothetical protein